MNQSNVIPVMTSIHGSHLYGLNTPNSDMDYKGIFIPESLKDIALGYAPKKLTQHTNKTAEKNTSEDVDTDFFSLHTFINMACEGEMIALDMIHTPDEMVVGCNLPEVWKFIRDNRSKFYTKSMKAYIGYARKQAAKYGIKGSRLAALEEVLEVIKPIFNKEANIKTHRLESIVEVLPVNEYCKWVVTTTTMGDQTFYEVLGKRFQDNSKTYTMYESLQGVWDKYGERAMEAKRNEGVDWKAVSHAFRAAFQLKQIFTGGDVILPFTDMSRDFLLDVKLGKLDFLTEVQPELEKQIDSVMVLAEESGLPERVDKSFWDDFVWDCYRGHCKVYYEYTPKTP